MAVRQWVPGTKVRVQASEPSPVSEGDFWVDTDADSEESIQSMIDAAVIASLPVYNVLNHGVTGIPNLVYDNATDNRQRFFDLYESVGDNAVYRFPAGGEGEKYLFSSLHGSTHSVETCLPFRFDNVFLIGDGPNTVLRFTGTSAETIWYIAPTGCMKPTEDFDDIFSHRYIDGTIYTMTGTPDIGDTSVTLATPAHAANFVAGDWCALLSGQTLPAPNNEQPDGQINRVKSVNAGTGVVELDWPLPKPFRQEYYVSGTTGLTTTSVTANAARFGLAKATANTGHNFGVYNMHLEQEDSGSIGDYMIHLMNWVGFDMHGVTFDTNNADSGVASISSRDVRYSIPDARHRSTGRRTASSPSVLCTDWQVGPIKAVNTLGLMFIHSHEGVANAHYTDIDLACPYLPSETFGMIDVTARAYNHTFDGLTLTGGGPTVVAIGDDCPGGGRITDITINSPDSDVAIKNASLNWHIEPPRIPSLVAGVAKQQIQFLKPTSQEIRSVPCRVTWNEPSRTTVTLPGPFHIVGVTMDVNVAFNAGGANQLHVGVAGAVDRFAYTTDAAVAGPKLLSMDPAAPSRIVPGAGFGFYNTLPDTIVVTFLSSGAAATQGDAFVVFQYVIGAWS